MSELKAMMKRHYEEIASLRMSCLHFTKYIKIELDYSVVGKGSAYPADHIICRNCGVKKIVFRKGDERLTKVTRMLERQGFKDERMGCVIQYERELD